MTRRNLVSLTFGGNVFDGHIADQRHVAQVREDDKSRKQARETVDAHRAQAISTSIIINFEV